MNLLLFQLKFPMWACCCCALYSSAFAFISASILSFAASCSRFFNLAFLFWNQLYTLHSAIGPSMLNSSVTCFKCSLCGVVVSIANICSKRSNCAVVGCHRTFPGMEYTPVLENIEAGVFRSLCGFSFFGCFSL